MKNVDRKLTIANSAVSNPGVAIAKGTVYALNGKYARKVGPRLYASCNTENRTIRDPPTPIVNPSTPIFFCTKIAITANISSQLTAFTIYRVVIISKIFDQKKYKGNFPMEILN